MKTNVCLKNILQEFESIKSWMCMNGTHQFCNTFSLVLMCRTDNEGDLLDCNGQKLTPINDVVTDIANTSTLNKKPKLIIVEAYPGKYPNQSLITILDCSKFIGINLRHAPCIIELLCRPM